MQESTPARDGLHWKLWDACRKLEEDYEPYGKTPRESDEVWHSDCSCGCRFYHPLEGKAGMDWGVCGNGKSHRCGLLTFEHQGCPHFESRPEEED